MELLQVFAEELPNAEHGFCVRHLHENFKKHFRGQALKGKLWNCTRATHPNKFKDGFETLNVLDPHVTSWLEKIPPFSLV